MNALDETRRVAVVGSRTGVPESAVWRVVNSLPLGTTIVSGRARRGVDAYAEQAAKDCCFDFDPFPADWERHGKIAGKLRNWPLVASADRVEALWDGWSNGTAHAIAAAVAQAVPVRVWLPTGFEHAREVQP
jgi:hypothetical protein